MTRSRNSSRWGWKQSYRDVER